MQTLIGSHSYNTETAKALAVWQNTNDTGNFNCEIDRLYRTPSGKFFLHEEGGAKTDRATRQLNWHTWGERIRPVSPDEALVWCSAKGKVEVALQYFGHLIQEA